VHNIKA